MLNYEDIKQNETINTYIAKADECLVSLGYTEHSFPHVCSVAVRTGYILETLDYPSRLVELGKIAGYLHDLGNAVNRANHAHTGAILADNILKDMGMNCKDRAEIMMAIGNHDEGTGTAVSDISAAIILADKSDAHRSRVSKKDRILFDKHDEVNYAVTSSDLIIDKEQRKAILNLTIDTKICPVIDYFEIFMDRTKMSKRAAKYLGLWFELVINNTNLL